MENSHPRFSHTHTALLNPAAYQYLHQTILKHTRFYTIVLSLALIVCYFGLLHPPQPPVNSPPPPSSSTYLNLFFYCNGFSFFSSLSGLLLSASLTFSPFILTCVHSSASVEKQTNIQLKHLAITLPKVAYLAMFLTLSLAFCAVGFLCAGLATVRDVKSARLELLVPCAVGGLVLLQAFFTFVNSGLEFWREIHASHVELWETLKGETLFGDVFARYVEYCSCDKSNRARSVQDKHSRNETVLVKDFMGANMV